MATGNFSNNGIPTFNALKNYIGIRLQQGVPLLDRDWNELEDIRHYYERSIRAYYLGQGVPDENSFKIVPTGSQTPNDFAIRAGRCIVNGYDVQNPAFISYTTQPNIAPIPPPTQDNVFYIYLYLWVETVNGTMDPALKNAQDINLETCVRQRLNWAVRYSIHPQQPPAGTYLLAKITRPKNAASITEAMIEDKRRKWLNLSNVVDKNNIQEAHLTALDTKVTAIQQDIVNLKQQVARMFWDVLLAPAKTWAYFGDNVSITITVKNGLGEAVKNAGLIFASDWGSIIPSTATTDNSGKVTVKLVGVEADTPPTLSEIAVMSNAVQRVSQAQVGNPDTLQYSKIKFEPDQVSVLSRFSPQSQLVDISYNPATGPIVSVPPSQPVTVMVYAKEGGGTVVRGIGSVQVFFRMWVRDWARTMIWQTSSKVNVDTRIGDIMRQSIKNKVVDPKVVTEKLPFVLDDIHERTYDEMRNSIFVNPKPGDDYRAGLLGEVIGRESTAIVGARAENAVRTQMQQYVVEAAVTMDFKAIKEAQNMIINTVGQYSAGQSQMNKQRYNIGMTFGN